jgi:hypothetical protein
MRPDWMTTEQFHGFPDALAVREAGVTRQVN